VIRDLPAADQVFDLDSYDTLPVNAFTRKAHRGLSSQEWPSVTTVIPPVLSCPVTDAIKYRMLEEAAQWAKYLGMQTLLLDLDWLPDNTTETAAFIARLLDETRYEGLHFALRMPDTEDQWGRWWIIRRCIIRTGVRPPLPYEMCVMKPPINRLWRLACGLVWILLLAGCVSESATAFNTIGPTGTLLRQAVSFQANVCHYDTGLTLYTQGRCAPSVHTNVYTR